MKKSSVIWVALMLMGTVTFAQHHHKGSASDRSSKLTDRMKKELSLTDEQYSRVKTINEQSVAAMSKLRQDTAITVGASRTQWKALGQKRQSDLKAVLTQDQWAKWTALKKEHHHDRKKSGHDKSDHDKSGKG